MLEEIRRQLETDGFVVARLAESDLVPSLQTLGPILDTFEVEVTPGIKLHAKSAGAIPFHTDSRDAKWIAWHCQRQDEGDGASLLVDLYRVAERLTDSELHQLSQFRLQDARLKSNFPLVAFENGKPQFFYAPWFVFSRDSEGADPLIEKFKALVAEVSQTPASIRLVPGETLIVCNRRVMHGRSPIAPASKRLLRRYWIGEQAPTPLS